MTPRPALCAVCRRRARVQYGPARTCFCTPRQHNVIVCHHVCMYGLAPAKPPYFLIPCSHPGVCKNTSRCSRRPPRPAPPRPACTAAASARFLVRAPPALARLWGGVGAGGRALEARRRSSPSYPRMCVCYAPSQVMWCNLKAKVMLLVMSRFYRLPRARAHHMSRPCSTCTSLCCRAGIFYSTLFPSHPCMFHATRLLRTHFFFLVLVSTRALADGCPGV